MFRGQVYQQNLGIAMDSPVSPILANQFTEYLEKQAMESAPDDLRPKLWKRYVDDTLRVIRPGKVLEWSEHLMNSTGSNKFAHEEETHNSVPFLDTHIHRRDNEPVKVKIYPRKTETHTNQYLFFDTHHPLHTKNGSDLNFDE